MSESLLHRPSKSIGSSRRGVNIRPVARRLESMRSRFIVALLLMAQVAVASQADAQSLVDPRGRDRNRDQSDQSGGMSLDEAVRMLESRYNARAVRAELSGLKKVC